jgi:hypothetical protein
VTKEVADTYTLRSDCIIRQKFVSCIVGLPNNFWQIPHPIILAVSRAAGGQITISGIPNCLICSDIFIMLAEFTNMAAGGMIRTGGPRVGNPWHIHTT